MDSQDAFSSNTLYQTKTSTGSWCRLLRKSDNWSSDFYKKGFSLLDCVEKGPPALLDTKEGLRYAIICGGYQCHGQEGTDRQLKPLKSVQRERTFIGSIKTKAYFCQFYGVKCFLKYIRNQKEGCPCNTKFLYDNEVDTPIFILLSTVLKHLRSIYNLCITVTQKQKFYKLYQRKSNICWSTSFSTVFSTSLAGGGWLCLELRPE